MNEADPARIRRPLRIIGSNCELLLSRAVRANGPKIARVEVRDVLAVRGPNDIGNGPSAYAFGLCDKENRVLIGAHIVHVRIERSGGAAGQGVEKAAPVRRPIDSRRQTSQ